VFFLIKGFITDRNTPQFHLLSGWLVSDNTAGEETGCGGFRLAWLHDILPNSLKRHLKLLMVEKITSNSLATALVDILAISMPIACFIKTSDICGIVLCDKTAHFRVAFYVPRTRCTCVLIMLFNQLLHMPHLSGEWIILTKEKCSLTGM
jgi:hypothetical protein